MRELLFEKSITGNKAIDSSIEQENSCVILIHGGDEDNTTKSLPYEKNRGDLRGYDIIWYVRTYLTRKEEKTYAILNQVTMGFSNP